MVIVPDSGEMSRTTSWVAGIGHSLSPFFYDINIISLFADDAANISQIVPSIQENLQPYQFVPEIFIIRTDHGAFFNGQISAPLRVSAISMELIPFQCH